MTTTTHPIHLSVVDGSVPGYATFQSHNQKVVSNDHGIFLTHLKAGEPGAYNAQTWRLMHSADGGYSFRVMHEEINATNSPVLETDAASNLYLARMNWIKPGKESWVYRWRAGQYDQPPDRFCVPGAAAGKYSMLIDEPRRQLYLFTHDGWFNVIGFDGVVRHTQLLMEVGRVAQLQYPLMALADDGTLVAAWTTNHNHRYLYWDIHWMISRDGGRRWQRVDGTPLHTPFTGDDLSPADRITHDDEWEYHTWLSALHVKGRKAHFVYWAETPVNRQRYIRIDLDTGRREIDNPTIFPGTTGMTVNDAGLLASDPTRPDGPIYFVSTIDQRLRPACLVSHDQGATWRMHAVSDTLFQTRVYSIGGFRHLTRDGHLIGAFTDLRSTAHTYIEPHGGRVMFFRIPAG